jgi:alpha-beta hydrolase superfamily lysophospholipase
MTTLVAMAMAAWVVTAAPAAAAGRNVIFTSGDGTPLVGTFYEASVRPAPAVVLVHMLGRTREDWAPLAAQLEAAGMMVLAVDLRGHGLSGGSNSALPPMVQDVRAAIDWMAARQEVRPDAIAVVGASLGANLALLAAADAPMVRCVGLLSPSLDYRGVRLDATALRKVGKRPLWLAASTQDPYALRTVKELAEGAGVREQRLSEAVAHGTNLLSADPAVASALVDWLRRSLIF